MFEGSDDGSADSLGSNEDRDALLDEDDDHDRRRLIRSHVELTKELDMQEIVKGKRGLAYIDGNH